MAGIVNEAYTLDVNVQEGGAAEQSVNVRAWNDDDVSVLDKTTDAQGDVTSTVLIAEEHSITGTSTLATTVFNPFRLRALKWLLKVLQVSINLGAPSQQTLFMESNPNITQTTQATVQAYTGITFNHTTDTLTLDGAGGTPVNDMDRLYDRCQDEAIVNEQPDPAEVLNTNDKANYILEYDWVIDGFVFDGQDRSVAFATGKDLTLQGSGVNIQDLDIVGDVNLGTGTAGITLDGIEISGALDFSIAGTYTITNSTIGEVTNSSGGAVTINKTNTTITTNTGPNITINDAVTVKVTARDANTTLPIQGARVFLEEDPGGTDIINDTTDVNGEVSTSYNFLSDQDVTGRVRKGTNTPLYKTAPLAGTITSIGYDVTVFMVTDE